MPRGPKSRARAAATKAAQSAPSAYVSPSVKCPKICKDLFKKYDIVIGTYDELKKVKMPGYQREHIIPNSCFMQGPGRKGATLPGTGNYSEGKAITYAIYDNQSQGTEHKHLTDKERAFAKKCQAKGKQATVEDWLTEMEDVTRTSLALKTIKRARDETKARATGSDATQLARCLAMACREQLRALKVRMDARLGNRLAGGSGRGKSVAKKKKKKK